MQISQVFPSLSCVTSQRTTAKVTDDVTLHRCIQKKKLRGFRPKDLSKVDKVSMKPIYQQSNPAAVFRHIYKIFP